MQDDSEVAGVLAANSAFYSAFSACDITAMKRLWAMHGEISVLHPGGSMLEGRESVFQSWETILSDPQSSDIEFGNGTVEFTDDEAVVKGSEFLGADVTKVVNVFRRQANGDWLLVFHGAELIILAQPGHA